ncbi:MAG: Uncharacterized protein G01um101417_366 [Parcubacteria group bacterium Gr01-1014_17]|nr:MAG: Uncharacterized protein G01um101417_366 [Parcubacteria group bacterium Gr01-1014_17]
MNINSQKGGVGVWILVIIVVVAAGIFWVVQNSSTDLYMPPPPDSSFESMEAVVTYDVNGFSPKIITIKKGGTVIFRNKTGARVSIASGAHPTHLLYPEFDQYKTDQRGKDEFRFLFEKVGEWKYHDHLNANMTGTVVVTE